MKPLRLIQLVIISLIALNGDSIAQTTIPVIEHPPNGHNSPYRIGFNEINGDPKYYDGQHLEVVGYLNLQFEVDALWLNEETFLNPKLADSLTKPISVDFQNSKHQRKFNHHYVVIDAVFRIVYRGLAKYNELDVQSIKRYRERTSDK